ncbi:hypothetical protein DES49_1860 [Halospina denitrificans]|uniref:Uncharacterized protein n=1 Tax=Halospina denitrificans TaxID=332522 RepID=A0A4V3EQG1_9GAMM|nr:hypothetical protein [Halospina denitrificans]TDT41758.1 hypothetical protein DES49_1860 [Halospina denitrificans]
MKMKVMQLMLVVAAILAALGIAVALSKGGIENPKEHARTYEPSGLMRSFGSLVSPPLLGRDELTEAGRAFPASLRLAPGTRKTFNIASGNADQRRLELRVTGTSTPFAITYEPSRGQTFNDQPVDKNTWEQDEAEKSDKVSFVIFNRGGTLIFDNTGNSGSTVSIRMEESP